MKGVNHMELPDFLEFGRKHNIVVRFIEAMPFNQDDGNHDVHMSATSMLRYIKEQGFPVDQKHTNLISSGNLYKSNDLEFGIIPAFTRSLCGMCNRIRLTPKGEFMTCLYSVTGKDLLSLLRNGGVKNEEIAAEIINAVKKKKKDGFEEEKLQDNSIFRSMTTIGG